MVAVRLLAVNVFVVLFISVTPEAKPLTVDDCHFVTFPVLPLSVKVVLLVPVQTVASPAIDPPTEEPLIVTVTGSRDVDVHDVPLHVITTCPLP